MGEVTPAQFGLLGYMQSLTVMHYGRKAERRAQGFAFSCIEEYLLLRGRLWNREDWRKPFGFAMMTPKQCFDNAYWLASSRVGLRYVEGYATSVIPILHAWCVDGNDQVIDLTWREFSHTNEVPSYFGAVFPLATVKACRSARNCSVLQDWENGYPVLRAQ